MEIKPYIRALPGLLLSTSGIRVVQRRDDVLEVDHDGVQYDHRFPSPDEAESWEEAVLHDLTPLL